jgi:hypothetical protein
MPRSGKPKFLDALSDDDELIASIFAADHPDEVRRSEEMRRDDREGRFLNRPKRAGGAKIVLIGNIGQQAKQAMALASILLERERKPRPKRAGRRK